MQPAAKRKFSVVKFIGLKAKHTLFIEIFFLIQKCAVKIIYDWLKLIEFMFRNYIRSRF